jgi:SanA protein
MLRKNPFLFYLMIFLFILIVCFGSVMLNYKIISLSTQHLIYYDVKKLPGYSVVLVPGAGDSVNNVFFKGRMNAVAEIYNSLNIKKIIVSGRNDLPGYNEPGDMEIALLERGICSEIIVKDYGAERTLESVSQTVNREIKDSVIIVTQQAHLERALFLAKANGLNAVGYAAQGIPSKYVKEIFTIREVLSRVRCTYDCLKILLVKVIA